MTGRSLWYQTLVCFITHKDLVVVYIRDRLFHMDFLAQFTIKKYIADVDVTG